MNAGEAEAEIRSKTSVTKQKVTFAKAFLYNLDGIGPYNPGNLIPVFAANQGYRLPEKIVLHPSVDPDPLIEQTVGYFTCAMAIAEATWSLIHSGFFWHFGPIEQYRLDQQWTTVVPGGGGTTAGWRFDDFSYTLPRELWKTPSFRDEHLEILTDPDIFLNKANIENADEEVIEAIGDAILCFKYGLYRPTVTMLGKAMEGAWIEFGCSIVNAALEGDDKEKERIIQKLQDDFVSIPAKIRQVSDLYKNKDLCNHIIKEAEILPSAIDSIIVWSDVLREARNAIHFGAKPTIPNSYEKVSVLLIDGAKNFSVMYKIKRIADNIVAQAEEKREKT